LNTAPYCLRFLIMGRTPFPGVARSLTPVRFLGTTSGPSVPPIPPCC
jgi:hypothetical protein